MPGGVMKQRYSWVIFGAVVGLLFWPFEALLHDFVFDKGDFISNLFSHDPDELWMRSLISLSFVVFGWLAQHRLYELHKFQDRLVLKRNRLSQIIDSTYDAYVAVDQDSSIVGWNRSAEKMFGWTRQDVIGRDMVELIVPESMRNAHRAGMKQYCETGIATMLYRPVRVKALHRDGSEFDVETVVTPLRSGDHQEFFSFMRRLD